MLFSDSYLTITKAAQGIYRDRGSKFLAFAFPVEKEEHVKEQLSLLRKEHPAARHHCYAWKLGTSGETYRSNDDGEPSGTAGKPILGQIQSSGLTNVLIVVVRYFGGTLLGVSGLIHAYREAAADAIKNADIEEKFILFEYRVTFPYEETGSVMQALKEMEAKILRMEYEPENGLVFQIRKGRAEGLENRWKQLYKSKLNYIRTL